MTLTKAQKLEAYTYAMFVFISKSFYDDHYFIGQILKEWHTEQFATRIYEFNDLFPEMRRQFPLKRVQDKYRLRAIERAIELTEKLND